MGIRRNWEGLGQDETVGFSTGLWAFYGFSPGFLGFYGFSGIGLEWELDVRMEGWMEYTMETHGYYNNWKATPKCHHVQ